MGLYSWASVPVTGRTRKVWVVAGKARMDGGQAIAVAQRQTSLPTKKVTCEMF